MLDARQRPVRGAAPRFLNLWQIHMPVGAWVSILHRLSGALLILGLPLLTYLLVASLGSPQSYAAAMDLSAHWAVRLALWLITWALCHHLLAGIRHLLLDAGLGIGRVAARGSAWVALAGAPLLALVLWL